MDDNTWSPITGFAFRSFTCISTNALVRRSDRLEAAAKLVAIVVALLVIAPVAALGTSLYDRELQVAARQAVEWQSLTATVVDSTAIETRFGPMGFRSHVRWLSGGSVHNASIESPDNLKSGDPTTVWVDPHGELVGPPLTRDQASATAFSAAALLWLSVSGMLCFMVWVLRHQLNRSRYAAWDTEWRELDRDNGGKKDRFRK